MMKLLFILVLTSNVYSHNLFVGSKTESKTKNENCSYNIQVPQIMIKDNMAKNKDIQQSLNNFWNSKLISRLEDWKELDKEATCKEFSSGNISEYGFFVSNSFSAPLISFVYKNYVYTGGAHGINWYESDVFDTVQTKKYKLSDFVQKKYLKKLVELVGIKLTERDINWDYGWNTTKLEIKSVDDFSFYLADNSIVIYFNPYVVSSYAQGIVELKLNIYGQISELLNENSEAVKKLVDSVY